MACSLPFPDLALPAGGALPETSLSASARIAAGGNGFAGAITSVRQNLNGTWTEKMDAGAVNQLQGDFFGPTANAVGGSFSAGTQDQTKMIGVFGAAKN